MEVEEFRNNLLQENQRLMEIISGLQSQIQNLESGMSSTSTSDELKKVWFLYSLGCHIWERILSQYNFPISSHFNSDVRLMIFKKFNGLK